MKRAILIDGMFCLYDKDFNLNKELLKIVNSFDARKILVVNGFREKGKKALEGNDFEAFSLEEEGIKKDDVKYFERLLMKFDLKADDVIYFDHDKKNVETARKLGIDSVHYKDNEQIKEFLQDNFK